MPAGVGRLRYLQAVHSPFPDTSISATILAADYRMLAQA